MVGVDIMQRCARIKSVRQTVTSLVDGFHG